MKSIPLALGFFFGLGRVEVEHAVDVLQRIVVAVQAQQQGLFRHPPCPRQHALQQLQGTPLTVQTAFAQFELQRVAFLAEIHRHRRVSVAALVGARHALLARVGVVERCDVGIERHMAGGKRPKISPRPTSRSALASLTHYRKSFARSSRRWRSVTADGALEIPIAVAKKRSLHIFSTASKSLLPRHSRPMRLRRTSLWAMPWRRSGMCRSDTLGQFAVAVVRHADQRQPRMRCDVGDGLLDETAHRSPRR